MAILSSSRINWLCAIAAFLTIPISHSVLAPDGIFIHINNFDTTSITSGLLAALLLIVLVFSPKARRTFVKIALFVVASFATYIFYYQLPYDSRLIIVGTTVLVLFLATYFLRHFRPGLSIWAWLKKDARGVMLWLSVITIVGLEYAIMFLGILSIHIRG